MVGQFGLRWRDSADGSVIRNTAAGETLAYLKMRGSHDVYSETACGHEIRIARHRLGRGLKDKGWGQRDAGQAVGGDAWRSGGFHAGDLCHTCADTTLCIAKRAAAGPYWGHQFLLPQLGPDGALVLWGAVSRAPIVMRAARSFLFRGVRAIVEEHIGCRASCHIFATGRGGIVALQPNFRLIPGASGN